MATDDRQVLVTGQESTPAAFVIPGNGQIQPKAIFAHYNGASAATSFVPALKVISDGGETVAICPCPTIVAAAGSADVSWFPHVTVAEADTTVSGVTVEELFLDSTSAGVTSATVLASGQPYLITVQGTYSIYNNVLNQGTPNADAMFPGSVVGRVSTQVGQDADTCFARIVGGGGPQLGHQTQFEINLGSGSAHVEPDGGPYATPQPNYLYRYTVTGQGSAATFRVRDAPLGDNYGKLQIQIQDTSGSSSGGGGAGSLLPPASVTSGLLRSVSGVPTWEAQPALTEADLSLSNVATGNVSTSAHGFAPIAPNDATKFLNGVGAYTVPPGGSGTISDLTSTGGTLTITAPNGPTTNVDMPTTGVGAGSYGDSGHVGSFTVDAEGRLTAASSVSITGGGTVAGADGWVTDTNGYTYASASSFTVGASDLTAVYSTGTRIKLTQTTVKYFVVTSSTFGSGTTTVNVTAGSDYTLANAAITAPFYSYVVNPQGFPSWFNFNPNAQGFSAFTSNTGRFFVVGHTCAVVSFIVGTSNATTFTFTLPVTAAQTSTTPVACSNSGTTILGRCVTTAASATATMSIATLTSATAGSTIQLSPTAFTNSGTKAANGMTVLYEI